MSPEEFFHAQGACAKLSLQREKRQVQGMVVALAALFKGDVLSDFESAIDKSIAEIGVAGFGNEQRSPDNAVARTAGIMKELNKLVEAGIIRPPRK